ncbi:MAG TPA: Ig-like domain-containing protein [Sporichthya sp.]|nr:Ig-like domain-containing protein [Sporichthya sp.]
MTDVPRGPRSRRISLAVVAAAVAAGATLGIAAARPSVTGPVRVAAKAATTAPSGLELSVAPADGASAVRPDFRVRVNARNGRITAVRVTPAAAPGAAAGSVAGAPLPGTLHRTGTVWTATGQLAPHTSYTVSADAVDAAGRVTTTTTTFRTRPPTAREQLHVSRIWPPDGSTVGIAAPVSVVFNHPVTDRAAVQSALQVKVTPAVPGGWFWVDTNTVDYRPRTFWPAGTKVSVTVSLVDVPAGGGLWGVGRRTSAFTVGRAQIINVDLREHVLTVNRAGTVVKQFPVSGGKPGWQTRNGTQLIMDRVRNKTWRNTAIDAPEHYVLHSDHAMRLTNSGEFIHDAPWNRGNIGSANTSHGCVGMNLSDMAWLYDNSIIGDPVIVTGSDRPHGVLWNLFMDWNVPWSQWARGNATENAN